MKKLIIAAFAVAFAAAVQAATVSWTMTGATSSNGTTALGTTAYLFAQTAANDSYSTMVATLVSTYSNSGASGVLSYLDNNSIATFKPTTAGTYSQSEKLDAESVYGLTGGETYNFYWVFVDTEGVNDSSMVALSKELTAKKVPTSSSNLGLLFGSQASYTGSTSWTALAPEPTSGLMLLLGMGVLALRRRRA